MSTNKIRKHGTQERSSKRDQPINYQLIPDGIFQTNHETNYSNLEEQGNDDDNHESVEQLTMTTTTTEKKTRNRFTYAKKWLLADASFWLNPVFSASYHEQFSSSAAVELIGQIIACPSKDNDGKYLIAWKDHPHVHVPSTWIMNAFVSTPETKESIRFFIDRFLSSKQPGTPPPRHSTRMVQASQETITNDTARSRTRTPPPPPALSPPQPQASLRTPQVAVAAAASVDETGSDSEDDDQEYLDDVDECSPDSIDDHSQEIASVSVRRQSPRRLNSAPPPPPTTTKSPFALSNTRNKTAMLRQKSKGAILPATSLETAGCTIKKINAKAISEGERQLQTRRRQACLHGHVPVKADKKKLCMVCSVEFKWMNKAWGSKGLFSNLATCAECKMVAHNIHCSEELAERGWKIHGLAPFEGLTCFEIMHTDVGQQIWQKSKTADSNNNNRFSYCTVRSHKLLKRLRELHGLKPYRRQRNRREAKGSTPQQPHDEEYSNVGHIPMKARNKNDTCVVCTLEYRWNPRERGARGLFSDVANCAKCNMVAHTIHCSDEMAKRGWKIHGLLPFQGLSCFEIMHSELGRQIWRRTPSNNNHHHSNDTNNNNSNSRFKYLTIRSHSVVTSLRESHGLGPLKRRRLRKGEKNEPSESHDHAVEGDESDDEDEEEEDDEGFSNDNDEDSSENDDN